ncbi:Rv1733c family protein [Streptomyces sp. CA-249302]|uniref:Rv1733c family protein n=1 Tax=Streptomyces sp. CA-249302 TaxID=3240058 RepID=UPI003D8E4FBC
MGRSGSATPGRVRWWRLRSNPLRRTGHLVEAWLILVTWTLAVVAAVVAGALTAGAVERDLDGLRTERHAVPAVLTEDADRVTSGADGTDGDHAWATVRWTAADGTTRTGVTRVASVSRAGSTTRVWLDAKGRLVPAPATAEQAEFQGAVLGVLAALGAGAVVLLAGLGVRARLERRLLEEWDTEWALIDPQWGRKAG